MFRPTPARSACVHLETASDAPNAATNPKLLVEVLSESTEAYDRGSKAAHYRRILSLQEYVLVAQDEPRIEVYRRNDEGGWVLYEAGPGERLELRSIGVSLDVAAVYENPLKATLVHGLMPRPSQPQANLLKYAVHVAELVRPLVEAIAGNWFNQLHSSMGNGYVGATVQ